MALEIVPEKDPTNLRPGDDFVVRVLRNGSAFANFQVGIVQGGNSHGEFQTTDADGRATFRLSKAGKCMLRGTDLRPSNKPDLEWESDFTTFTIEVR